VLIWAKVRPAGFLGSHRRFGTRSIIVRRSVESTSVEPAMFKSVPEAKSMEPTEAEFAAAEPEGTGSEMAAASKAAPAEAAAGILVPNAQAVQQDTDATACEDAAMTKRASIASSAAFSLCSPAPARTASPTPSCSRKESRL
jgi:hypothetical protein